MEELHTHINSLEPSITFTKEAPSSDGSVPFLDTKCVPQPDGSIRTVVYRKPTHTDLYVQWNSHHPLSAKLSVVSSLFHRASVVCRHPEDLKMEYDHLTKVLGYNGYPLWAINKAKQKMDKPPTSSHVTGEKSSKSKSYVVMDYVKGLSERIRDILKKKGIQTYFKANNTLRNILVSPKDKDPKLSKQDVIYHIPCGYPSCESSYIGETGRILEERIKDHISNNSSAIKQHHINTGHSLPDPNDNNIKVINTESNAFKRRVKEAIYIKVNNPPLNQNVGKFNLPPIYDQLLDKKGAGGKLLISKTVKDATPKSS